MSEKIEAMGKKNEKGSIEDSEIEKEESQSRDSFMQ